MLLAIDAGNTNVVFALVGGGGGPGGSPIRARWRVATDPRRTADEYAAWLNQLLALEGVAVGDVRLVIIATVVPRALQALATLARRYFRTEPLVAGEAPVDWGTALGLAEPRNLGADRAVNAIAAHAGHAGDLIVIDLGTATTIDWIDASGAYRGGIIAPGVNLSLDALVAAAAKLPRIAIEAPATGNVIGATTIDQMQIGVYWGYVGLVEGLVGRMTAQIGRPVRVIATGGLATLFERHVAFDVLDPDLTIRGLAIMAERAHIAT